MQKTACEWYKELPDSRKMLLNLDGWVGKYDSSKSWKKARYDWFYTPITGEEFTMRWSRCTVRNPELFQSSYVWYPFGLMQLRRSQRIKNRNHIKSMAALKT